MSNPIKFGPPLLWNKIAVVVLTAGFLISLLTDHFFNAMVCLLYMVGNIIIIWALNGFEPKD
jgi:hypothetical protein